MRERDAALLAHQLEFILNRQAIPLYSVPDRPDGDDRVVLDEVAGQPIAPGPAARRPMAVRLRDRRADRAAEEARLDRAARGSGRPGRDGRGPDRPRGDDAHRSPGAAMGRRDFAMAARCLDLRDIPPKLRASEGAQLARKLAFVMQRCGFMFSQEVPNDPDGYRYVWHSNHRGRIMLERVRLPEGQDAWLFSRGTLRNLDALVEGHRATAPDPRYATIGVVIGEDVLAAGKDARVPPPPGVPAGARLAPQGAAHLSSSRWTSWSSTPISPKSSWHALTSARSRRRTAPASGCGWPPSSRRSCAGSVSS